MKEPVCTVSSLAAGEPLIGSAPYATAWVCLEQDGPWGARAFTESHLDPVLGAEIQRVAAEVGARPMLIRRPGRHADRQADPHPMVLVAHTDPGDPWLYAGRLDASADVLDLDWVGIAAGQRPDHPALVPVTGERLLVCTNGARDTCCARFGRPIVQAAAAAHPDRVWEVTHTSGHRFAPTTVLLPSGNLHGRITDPVALLEAADDGHLPLEGWRGRSTWPPAGQAAEELVRRTAGITDLHALRVVPDGDRWLVSDADGHSWPVDVRATPALDADESPLTRAESCGKELKPMSRLIAEAADQHPQSSLRGGDDTLRK